MSDLVGNPEDRFSRVAAQVLCPILSMTSCFLLIKRNVATRSSLDHMVRLKAFKG